MGYSIELFEDPAVYKEFLCSICEDVVQYPMLVDPCEHAFCGQCIGPWNALSGGKCPDCPEYIESLKAPPRIYMRMLNGLRVRCSFKAEGQDQPRGCPEVMSLGELESHKKLCEFNPDREMQCGGGCGATIAQARLAQHKCIPHLLEVVKKMQVRTDTQADQLAAKDKTIKELEAVNDKLTRELEEVKKEPKTAQDQDELLKHQQEGQATTGSFGGHEHANGQAAAVGPPQQNPILRSDIICTFSKNIGAHRREEILDTIFDLLNRPEVGFPTSGLDVMNLQSWIQDALNRNIGPGSTYRAWTVKLYWSIITSRSVSARIGRDESMIAFALRGLAISCTILSVFLA